MYLLKQLLFALLLTSLIACAPAMNSISENGLGDCLVCDSNNEDLSRPVIAEDELDELDGYASSLFFNNHQVIRIDPDEKEVILSTPLPVPYILSIPDQAIPNMDGAYYRIARSNNGMSQLDVHIPFKYFVPNGSGHVADRLPNGDKLPAIPGGEYPSYGIEIWDFNRAFYIYIGPSIIALYVTTPEFNPYLPLNFPIKNYKKTKVLGYVSLVPKKNRHDGGVYVSAQLPSSLARFLDDIIP